MKLLFQLQTSHDSLIHDVSIDFYGKRIATCSSDQKIKVWEKKSQGRWVCSSEWKAHNGSIWKIVWAHPQFGQCIASCSFDQTVCIWEEQDEPIQDQKNTVSYWAKKATISDGQMSIQDIKFAPSHFGLKLATADSSGMLRMYEAPDIMDLSRWAQTHEFQVSKLCVNSMSWNISRGSIPMIAIASNDRLNPLQIWEFIETSRKWTEGLKLAHDDIVNHVDWAPQIGRSFHLIATASKDGKVRIWKLDESAKKIAPNYPFVCEGHTGEVWKVEWNITGTILASSADDGTVRLWRADIDGKWNCLSIISTENKEKVFQNQKENNENLQLNDNRDDQNNSNDNLQIEFK
ncbi:nucleoporin seh1 [Anaeramoeba ignava]|uniref:Nucleoporin seh1 n=1 Tax=Anaeramoeba ignava TaxID=1746090 RepID=A0A9Q0R4X8_ANAIG|nr:nucleoporin seh1 [Anaeramoeba ignava]